MFVSLPFFVERSVWKNEFQQKPVSGFPTRIRAQVLEILSFIDFDPLYRQTSRRATLLTLKLFFSFFLLYRSVFLLFMLLRHRRLCRPFVCERAITFIRLNEHFQRSVAIRETRSVRRPSQFRGHDTLDGGGLRENRV